MQFLKNQNINAIKLDIPWSDLGSWKEISIIFNKNKLKYFKKRMSFIDHGEAIQIYLKVKIF